MAFKSFREYPARPRNTDWDALYDFVSFSTVSNGKGYFSLFVAITNSIAKKAKLSKGDSVDILFDESARLGLIKRADEGGLKLANGRKNARLCAKTPLKPGFPTVAIPAQCKYKITEEGIVFELPEQVSFTENMRIKQILANAPE